MPGLIIIEFVGGYRDGDVIRTDRTEFEEAHEAWLIFLATRNGTIGRGFRSISFAAEKQMKTFVRGARMSTLEKHGHLQFAARHKYFIAKREEEDGIVSIKMAYSLVR